MKPFLDPFPFRKPETRSSIGEVIAEITKAELKAAEAQDLKELPGAKGEAAHKRLHKTIGKFLKAKPVTEGKKGVGAYTVIKKSKTVQKGSAADSTPDTTTTEYDVTKRGVKVGSAQRDNYFGQTSGTVHGKRFSGTGSAQTDLHRFLKSKRGATVREEVVQESHTRTQLEKMTTTRLRELKKKYEGLVLKGDRDAARELATIRGLLRAKGAGSVLDEGAATVVGEDTVHEMAQTPARAEETKRLRIQARKAAKTAADKLDAIRDKEWNEKNSPDLYGSKGKVVKPTKKMLKTRASTEKAKKTKYANQAKKDQEFEDARKETFRKNMKTPEGRAIYRASIAQSKRNDGGW
jgi:hypothetical protein